MELEQVPSMLPVLVLVLLASYLLMLAGYFLPKRRAFHISVMVFTIGLDVALPVYLYTHRNWWHRLIEQQEIFSSLIWMHFALLIALYALEAAQVYTAAKMLKGDMSVRADHHAQGKALLVVRGLLILSGAILIEPE
jgi:hypothetical protein